MVCPCETSFKCDTAGFFVFGRHSNTVVIMIKSGADNPLCGNFKYQCRSNINRHNATTSRRIICKNTHYLLKVKYFHIFRYHNLP